MKKQLIPIFVLSALLAGCSAGEETGNALPDDAPVPILLGSGLSMEAATKAPVSTNDPIHGWHCRLGNQKGTGLHRNAYLGRRISCDYRCHGYYHPFASDMDPAAILPCR